MYALVVNDVTMSPAAMWSHDHAKLSDVDALHSRCVAELAEVAALLRNVNVSSSSCCHVMTGAIKRALRSYAPLLTFAAHDAWVEAAASGDERRLAKLAVSQNPILAYSRSWRPDGNLPPNVGPCLHEVKSLSAKALKADKH